MRLTRHDPRPARVVAALLPVVLVAASLGLGSVGGSHTVEAAEPIVPGVPGDIRLTAYPVGPGQSGTLKLLLKNNLTTGDDIKPIDEVTFSLPNSEDGVRWHIGRSEAAGWTTQTPKLIGGRWQLTFTAEGTNAIPSPGQKLFRLGYEVDAEIRNDVEVRIFVRSGGGPSQAGFSFDLVVDDTAPEALASTAAHAAVRTADADRNGYLDKVYVTFDERLDESTFALNDWRVGGYRPTKHTFRILQPGVPVAVDHPTWGTCPGSATTAGLGCSQLELFLAEGTRPDTGAQPEVRYVESSSGGGGLRDLANNTLEFDDQEAFDGAHPILLSAQAAQGSPLFERVDLRFSEPVKRTSGSIDAADFNYSDVSSAGGTPQQVAPGDPTPDLQKSVEMVQGDTIARLYFYDDAPDPPTGQRLNTEDAPGLSRDQALPPTGSAQADIVACRPGPDMIIDATSRPGSIAAMPCLTVLPDRAVPVLGAPTAVEAVTNIGSREVTMTFNVPIRLVRSGEARGFDVQATSGSALGGLSNVLHSACTPTVRLTLNAAVRPTDVDSSPSSITVLEDSVETCGGDPLVMGDASTPLRDRVPPSISTEGGLTTIDKDRNGVIDGFVVRFSEPVQDISFCRGSNPCPVGGMLKLADPDVERNLDGYGPFTFSSTDTFSDGALLPFNEPDDEYGIISWPQNDPEAPLALGTGFVPDLSSAVAGLFQDTAPSPVGPNEMAGFDVADITELDGAPPILVSARTYDNGTAVRETIHVPPEKACLDDDNDPIPNCAYNETQALRTIRYCTLFLDAGCVPEPNGYIDAYLLTFSERVVDSSIHDVEWTVEDRVLDLRPSGVRFGDLHTGNNASNAIDDEFVMLHFCEGPKAIHNGSACASEETVREKAQPDTGATPELTYRFSRARNGVRDLAGNSMADLSRPEDIDEKDGARPVIVRAEGFLEREWLRIVFSEGVDDGVGGGLVRSDLFYQNDGGGATGILTSPQVEHEAGDRIAVVHLDRALECRDFTYEALQRLVALSPYTNVSSLPNGNAGGCAEPFERNLVLFGDRLAAVPGSVFEAKTDSSSPLSALGTLRDLSVATDEMPPDPVIDLNTTQIIPNAVVLSWIAPGDDGQEGTVLGYAIKVSRAPILDFEEPVKASREPQHDLQDPQLMEVELDPSQPVAAGLAQQARVSGLAPQTEYYFTVIAVDDAGNPSEMAPPIRRTTDMDLSPPTGSLSLQVISEDPKTRQVTFQWDQLEDMESDIDYHYVLSRDAEAEVTRDSDRHRIVRGENQPGQPVTETVTAPASGAWYLHMRAYSGIGGPPAMAPVNISAPPVDTFEINQYNRGFNDPLAPNHSVVVQRTAGGNQVNWTLPPDLPGDLEGLRILRLDDGAWVEIHNMTGGYQELRAGGFFDDTEGNSKSSRYWIDTVFAGGQRGDEPDPTFDTGTPVSGLKEGMPWWVWLLMILGGVLLAGGIVLLLVVRSRNRPDALMQEGWSEVGDEAALPRHEVDCPQCQHHFEAVGHLPLPITCPECGISGKLE